MIERGYFVLCREDTKPDGSKGDYVLATRWEFATFERAQCYAFTINESREPFVVQRVEESKSDA